MAASAVTENALAGKRSQHSPKRAVGDFWKGSRFLYSRNTLSVSKASHQLLETNRSLLELRCRHTQSDLPQRVHWSGGQRGGDAASSPRASISPLHPPSHFHRGTRLRSTSSMFLRACKTDGFDFLSLK